jgi:hypothetical protein
VIQQKDLRQWLAECNVDMDKVNINFVSESQKGVKRGYILMLI